MNNLKCPICRKNDGMQMYGVVVCKAALARVNAEKAERQRVGLEPTEAKRARDREVELLTALEEESVRKSSVIVEVIDLRLEVQALRLQVVKCAEETEKACSEAAQYKEWLTRAEEELQETRARADKAEADLASCLAATNEALEEALTHGREAENGPHRALVQAVRAAARLGAEEMQKTAVAACRLEEEKWALAANGYNNPLAKERHTARSGVAADLVVIITALPLPGDEMKPKRPPSHSMRCLPLGLDSWRCGEGCTIHAVSMEDEEAKP